MNVLLLLIPISLVLLGIAVAAFAWAVRQGQFEDLDTAALDVLVDDAATKAGPDGPAPGGRGRAG